MRKLVLCWTIGIWSRSIAQEVWLLRGPEVSYPPLQARAYRTTAKEWVIYLRADLERWMPYVFDSVFSVKITLHSDKGIEAEGTLTLPAQRHWQGVWRSELPPRLAGKPFILRLSFPEAAEDFLFTWIYLPKAVTGSWIASSDNVLSSFISLHDTFGRAYKISPQDSLWQIFLHPAEVDTSAPLLPYIQRKAEKSKPVPHPGAWYLRRDSSQVFWHGYQPAPYSLLPKVTDSLLQRAFQLFSDTKPGERSDRGLVYLAWGPPPVEILSPFHRIWVYPEKGWSFHFRWRKGTWHLDRKLEYQAAWQNRGK
ncbi:MAG: hypothetical protein NZ580_00570 [Bacteroidia bacterium]|nr:hypothetical protein [Bacteroidia bacterium]MDW8235187.1 GWxTD domain-containing protein [Bacteroidia bacterium]